MRIKKIKKKQIFLYLPFLIIPKVQKEPNHIFAPFYFAFRKGFKFAEGFKLTF